MSIKRADLKSLKYEGQSLMQDVKTPNMGVIPTFGPDPLESRKINFGTLNWESGNANVDRSAFLRDVGVYASSKFLDDFLGSKNVSMQGREADSIP